MWRDLSTAAVKIPDFNTHVNFDPRRSSTQFCSLKICLLFLTFHFPNVGSVFRVIWMCWLPMWPCWDVGVWVDTEQLVQDALWSSGDHLTDTLLITAAVSLFLLSPGWHGFLWLMFQPWTTLNSTTAGARSLIRLRSRPPWHTHAHTHGLQPLKCAHSVFEISANPNPRDPH